MKTNILLLGASLLSGNKGVNALTRGAIIGVIHHNPFAKIKILSFSTKEKVEHKIEIANQTITVDEIPCDFKKAIILSGISIRNFVPKSLYISLVKKIDPSLNQILSWADLLLDISEGDSFSDIYGIKRFIMHSNLKKIGISYGKKVILMPQTMGPFENFFVKRSAKWIFNHSTFNYVRDELSLKLLTQDLSIDKSKVKFYPDLAFNMTPDKRIHLREFAHINNENNIVGINVSGLLYNGGYNKKNMFGFKTDYKEIVEKIVDYILKNTDYNVVLIPHVLTSPDNIEDDRNAGKKIMEKFSNEDRIYNVKQDLKEDKIKGLISQCDFFIGGRMHACIGAISTNVPTVPIAYSRKFIGVWKYFELEKCVADPREHSVEDILDIVRQRLEEKEHLTKLLINKNKVVKEELKKLFNDVLV